MPDEDFTSSLESIMDKFTHRTVNFSRGFFAIPPPGTNHPFRCPEYRRGLAFVRHLAQRLFHSVSCDDTARDIVNRIEELKHGSQVEKKVTSVKSSQNDDDLRTIGVGAQILTELGVRKMRVMSAPKHLHALAGFDLEVTEFVNTEEQVKEA